MTDNLFTSVELKNGIVVNFFDHSNRYFGDFHRVKIDVVATLPFTLEQLPEDLRDIAANYSGQIEYQKTLEQMGVETGNLKIVAKSLIDNFISSAGNYLEKGKFVELLLRKQLELG